MNSQYRFLTQPSSQCTQIIYTSLNMPTQSSLRSIISGSPREHTMVQLVNVVGQAATAQNTILVINQPNIVHIITPMNFCQHAHYTFNEIAAVPILLYTGHHAHSILKQYIDRVPAMDLSQGTQYTQFQMTSLPADRNHLCFCAYSVNSTANNISDLRSYLNNIQQVYANNSSMSSSITITLVYHLGDPLQPFMSEAVEFVKQYNTTLKLRIQFQRILLSIQAYHTVHSYCPTASTMVNSRMHIQFMPSIGSIESLCPLSHQLEVDRPLLIFSNYPHDGSPNLTTNISQLNYQPSKRRTFADYQTHFKHVHIFCSQLLAFMQMYQFKHSEVNNFYEGQYSIGYSIYQIAANRYKFIQQPLYAIRYNRTQSAIEIEQKRIFKLRRIGTNLTDGKFYPIPYNSLKNRAYKRNAPDLIPKIIHQIYLSDLNMSQVRYELMQTVIKKNPKFRHMLWTIQNITETNFPYTHKSIRYLLALETKSTRNVRPMVADLMRIQILYHYGGLYFDFKDEGKKELDPFLKYQTIHFIYSKMNLKGAGSWLQQPDTVVGTQIGFLGAVPNLPQFGLIISQFFTEQNIKLTDQSKKAYQITGKVVVGCAYSQQEVFVQVHFIADFIFGREGSCLTQKNFSKDQKIFTIQRLKAKAVIGIPCKIDDGKYLQQYRALARSYDNRVYN